MTHFIGKAQFLDSGYMEKWHTHNNSYENKACFEVLKYLEIKEKISKIILEKKANEFFSPSENEQRQVSLHLDILMSDAFKQKKNINRLISEREIIKNTEYYFDGYNCWRIKKYVVNNNVFTKFDRFFRAWSPFFTNENVQLYKIIHHKKFKVLKIFNCKEEERISIKNNNIIYKRLAEQGSMKLFMKYKGENSNLYISKSYDCDLFQCLGCLDAEEKLIYIRKILVIVLYIQKINFLHGDLKPENLLVDKTNNSLVVGDLDGGVFLGKTSQEIEKTALDIYLKRIEITQTENYFSYDIKRKLSENLIAHDILLKCCRNFDIYSCCVIIVEILIGRNLDQGEQLPDIILQVDALKLTTVDKYNLLLLISAMKDPLTCDLEKQIALFDSSIIGDVINLMQAN